MEETPRLWNLVDGIVGRSEEVKGKIGTDRVWYLPYEAAYEAVLTVIAVTIRSGTGQPRPTTPHK